jgi:small GTP-binding protein
MWTSKPSSPEQPYEFLLKVIVVGDSSVGKSCLLLRYVDKRFRKCHEVTIGVEFGSRIVETETVRFKTHVWDTSGQEAFRSITRSYYRTAAVALLVFDVTKRSTFEHLLQWSSDVLAYASPGVVLAVVASKTDLQEAREVFKTEAEGFAAGIGALYFETSAKDAVGVDEAFVVPCTVAIGRYSSTTPSNVCRLTPPPGEARSACCAR